MSSLELIFVSGVVGILIGFAICWSHIRKLEFERDMVLDFNEKLIRDREDLEFRYEHEAKAYIRHLDSHCCVFVPEEEGWPTEISFQ